jgi:hypothetical protein
MVEAAFLAVDFRHSYRSVTLEVYGGATALRLARLAVWVVLVASVLGSCPARAQKGVFGTLTAVFAPSGSGYSSYGTAGAGVGLYDTFLKGGPVGLGFEVRGLAAPSTYELMAGGRLAINGKKFRPYGVVVLGLEGQRNGFQSTGSQFGYQVGGGLDISQGRWFDWRAVDITGGQLLTVSTGVVVRF